MAMGGWKRVIEQPQRVLITRLSAIGDCVLTLPLAVQIKRLWPSCQVAWAVSCAARQFLVHHPAVDNLIEIPRRWLNNPASWAQLRRDLQSNRFDLVFDPQGLTKSGLLAWLSGAPTRIGFDRSQAREIAPWAYTHRVRRTRQHMVDTFLELLSPWFEIPPGQGDFDFPRFPEAANQVQQWLDQLRLSDAAWVGLNPGAGWPTRQWPPQRFGMLARELHRDFDRRSLVFWSGEQEHLAAQIIVEESRGGAQLAPPCSLLELTEFLRRCRLFVCGDTGPLHLASAVGTPTVSLHGPTWSDVSGPYRNPHRAIQSAIPTPSRKLKRSGPPYAMLGIELSEVLAACVGMIEQAEDPASRAAA
ncbi:MAG: lipopolysaccharide heptosyltransferase family protein [Planctomycetota bacterium]|nr:MAG: lipopolysaccharide heptosyltransferase family protein [Planctomycetota bacterium]